MKSMETKPIVLFLLRIVILEDVTGSEITRLVRLIGHLKNESFLFFFFIVTGSRH